MNAPQLRHCLRNCQGFRVEGPRGHVGVVEDVLYGQDPAEPSALLLRAGFFHLRMEVVPVDAVAAIDPRRERVTLVDT